MVKSFITNALHIKLLIPFFFLQATPHVAGVLALHLSDDPTLTPASIKAWLTDVATPDVVVNPGTNSPNLLLYSPNA